MRVPCIALYIGFALYGPLYNPLQHFYSMPETVGDFLKEHSLSKYADALEEHGWDSLSHLQAISDHGLQQLIADVAMPSGHAARLRNALGKPSAATAAPPTMPGAVPAAPAATAASQPGQEAAACALDAAGSAELQKKLFNKLLETDLMGQLAHGTTIQTYQAPTGGEVMIRVVDQKQFYCICCPIPNGSKLADKGGARSSGNSMSNILSHLGSKEHFTRFRLRAFDQAFDQEEWTKFTMGNRHGPARTKKTKQHAQREAKRDIKRERQKASGGTPQPPRGMWEPGTELPVGGAALGGLGSRGGQTCCRGNVVWTAV